MKEKLEEILNQYLLDLSDIPTKFYHGKEVFDWTNSMGCEVKSLKYNEVLTIVKYDAKKQRLYFDNGTEIKTGNLLRGWVGEIFNPKQSTAVTHPDLIVYFKNSKDAYQYTAHSNRKVSLKCPICGYEKKFSLYVLSERGFSCGLCSDGVSIPEKFLANVLTQANIDFKTQYRIGENNLYRYDFYLPKYNVIIEVHGEQHYGIRKVWGGFTCEDIHFNDLLKIDLADYHGYELNKNYFVIDCRYSELEYLKENVIKTLGDLIDFSMVNWEQAFINCQKSYVVRTWELRNEGYGRKEIEEIFKKEGIKISGKTIIDYLNLGNKLKKCYYVGKEEMKKSGIENIAKNRPKNPKRGKENKRSKAILALHKETGKILQFPSIHDAEKEGFGNGNVSNCCNNKFKRQKNVYKGYHWCFESNLALITFIIMHFQQN